MRNARDTGLAASIVQTLASTLVFTPDIDGNLQFWGTGLTVNTPVGTAITKTVETAASILRMHSAWQRDQAQIAARRAGYERRADDWKLQSNLAARELTQIGQQIISSLIREQIARHEYENLKTQIEQAKEVDQFLQEKFTNGALYGWMQGELSKLYYEYYKFAFDIARKAEQTMKHELMRPELDDLNFIKFNYWDSGRKGLLSGEALHLDLKRMEMAYHDHNKREYELTKHISLRQLDPVALLNLKVNGSCEVTIPEWLFDLDTPGHYMRRIKNVSLSIPAVTGPYTSINCTLSLQKSTLRRSSLLRDDEYPRVTDEEDTRFIDYYGTIQSIVTSNGQNDSGMFETNLRDERFLPFEGQGVVSTWRLELPAEFRQFDYNSISDVIIHMSYTARQGGNLLRKGAESSIKAFLEEDTKLVQLFSLRHDFATEWHRFTASEEDFTATVKKSYFPYLAQTKKIALQKAELYAIENIAENNLILESLSNLDMTALNTALQDNGEVEISIAESNLIERKKTSYVFLLFTYKLLRD
ncbi:MAG: hypothetical protein AAGI69_28600 [Cyanobacteria bacterium P01_H01_bin.21]